MVKVKGNSANFSRVYRPATRANAQGIYKKVFKINKISVIVSNININSCIKELSGAFQVLDRNSQCLMVSIEFKKYSRITSGKYHIIFEIIYNINI